MMRVLDIRSRMLLAALLPLVLISTLLAVMSLLERFGGMQDAYDQRNRSVVRQIALASEYGLFSANQVQLQALTNGVMQEADVRLAVILDRYGRILASTGDRQSASIYPLSSFETQGFDGQKRIDWLIQPVFASSLPIDDLFEKNKSVEDRAHSQLGQVMLVFSRQSVDERQRTMLILGGVIGLLSLAFGVALAVYLSRGVLNPIARIASMIERIGKGENIAPEGHHPPTLAHDPLHELQDHIYRMADRLAAARDDLEQQVSAATRALREKKEEAEMANLAKSRFLAAASHDLRQPTHALGLFVSRLSQLPHDAQTGDLIVNLEASVRAMQNLLDGLLDISRLEARAVQVNKRAFALSGLFDQLKQDLLPAFQEKGLQLRIRPTSVWVHSDATLIYRILLNLVGNSLRYTEHGGVLVAARSRPSTDQVFLQVWDTGIGIAAEYQQTVFTEFFQVANSARDRTKGLGLGLNIVQRTAQLLAHPLNLVSILGRGTQMSLALPVVGAAIVAETSSNRNTAATDDLHDHCVLVIEDDAMVRLAMLGLLESWGLQVLQAEDCANACQHLKNGALPQVIISDYRLPDGPNGINTIQHLRTLMGHAVPACLMSGDTAPKLMAQAQALGLTLLHKPVRPAKLRALLRRLLQGQSATGDDLS